MPTGTLIPTPYQTVLSASGAPVSGALISFYLSGTSTPLTVYSDAALTIPLSNPVVADSAGRYVAYMSATSAKMVIADAGGVTIRTVDPVTSTGAAGSGLVGAALGPVANLFGDPNSPITATSYPSGAGVDMTHAGSAIFAIDSANLAPGTYVLEAMAMASGGTVTVALVDLSGGLPDTPLATASSTNATGELITSGAITFAASGTSHNYAIKVKTSAGSGYIWGARIRRTV